MRASPRPASTALAQPRSSPTYRRPERNDADCRPPCRETRLSLCRPGLYHRLGELVIDPVDPEPSVAAIRAVAVASLTPARLRADMLATLDWLYAEASVLPGARGIIGFGGRRRPGRAWRRIPIRVSGSRLDPRRGLHPSRNRTPAPALAEFAGGAFFGFAGQDEIIPLSAVDALRGVLRRGVAHEIVVHPGVGHGYLFANRPAYAAAAAEQIGCGSARCLPGIWRAPLRARRKSMPGRLEGKVAIVCGAGASEGGVSIGMATAVTFAREGAAVFAVDRDMRSRHRGRHPGRGRDGRTAPVRRHDGRPSPAWSRLAARFGRIDVLFNNVGFSCPGGPLRPPRLTSIASFRST